MYECETLTPNQLERQAISWCMAGGDAENDARNYVSSLVIGDLINIYLKDKPGTWRLISMTYDDMRFYFVWETGD